MSSQTNVPDFVGELNGGALIEQLSLLLSEAALATIVRAKGNQKAKVSLDISFTQMGDNDQVIVEAKISKSIPTKNGKKTEDNTTQTPFYVGVGGVLTINQPRESLTGQFSLQPESEINKVRSIK